MQTTRESQCQMAYFACSDKSNLLWSATYMKNLFYTFISNYHYELSYIKCLQMLWVYCAFMSTSNLNNTVHHSVAVNLTSSHLLSCFKLFLYALLRYTEFFCAMHLSSPLPCSSVVLHQVTETVMPVLDFLWTLLCVSLTLRTNVMSVLCHHWPTQQLALPPSATLHLSSSLLSSTSHLSLSLVGVCFSLAPSYFYLIPFF